MQGVLEKDKPAGSPSLQPAAGLGAGFLGYRLEAFRELGVGTTLLADLPESFAPPSWSLDTSLPTSTSAQGSPVPWFSGLGLPGSGSPGLCSRLRWSGLGASGLMVAITPFGVRPQLSSSRGKPETRDGQLLGHPGKLQMEGSLCKDTNGSHAFLTDIMKPS